MAIESAGARPRTLPNIFRKASGRATADSDAGERGAARDAAHAPRAEAPREPAAYFPAHVVFISGANAGERAAIGDAPLILGARGKRNGRARLTRAAGAFVLRQLDAGAVASVNGEPVGDRAVLLAPGDVIVVDGETMRFENAAATARAPRRTQPRGGMVRRAMPGMAAALGIVAVAFAAAGGYLFVDRGNPPTPGAREAAISATSLEPQIVAIRSGTGRASVEAGAAAFELRVTVTAADGVTWFWCFDDDPSLGDGGGRFCRARIPADGATTIAAHDVRIAPPADGSAFVDLYCSGDCTWQVETEAARP